MQQLRLSCPLTTLLIPAASWGCSRPAQGALQFSASGLLPGLRQSGEFFVGVLQSRTAQQALVDQFHLQAYYHAKNAEDACRSLSKKSSFNDNLKSGIVSITVQDHDPKMAAALANAYAGELDHLLTHNSTSAAGRERVFLEKRLRQVKADLDVSSKALSTYASKNRTIDIPSQAKLMMEAGMHLNLELASTRAELVALRQTYSSDNARVRAAEARMAELQRQVGQINGSINSGNKEAEASGYPAISALPTLALGFTDLQRRAAVDEALWSALTKQYEAARVQEAKEIPTVRLLDPAEVPTQKSTADRAVVLLMGAVLGLFVGIFAAVMRTCWQGVAREKKELMFALLPFAGAR